MLVIGLTGGIGSGKTIVSDLFSKLGVPIIDTDLVARELVQIGQPALASISTVFGKTVLNQDGSLNRARLGEITFNNPEARKQLESILHPEIRDQVNKRLKQLHSPYAMVVIPLLIETGDYSYVDRILVVDCELQTQINRVKQRDHRSQQQIDNILQAQVRREQRLSVANDVIENNADQDTLLHKVEDLHHKYLALARSEKV
ncbi:MAG: dephospho-CoA kinase [Gammaproteobacteria bacterium]|nr:dephospho-CoA kinase [Gammaproteobacteria bacterium]